MLGECANESQTGENYLQIIYQSTCIQKIQKKKKTSKNLGIRKQTTQENNWAKDLNRLSTKIYTDGRNVKW